MAGMTHLRRFHTDQGVVAALRETPSRIVSWDSALGTGLDRLQATAVIDGAGRILGQLQHRGNTTVTCTPFYTDLTWHRVLLGDTRMMPRGYADYRLEVTPLAFTLTEGISVSLRLQDSARPSEIYWPRGPRAGFAVSRHELLHPSGSGYFTALHSRIQVTDRYLAGQWTVGHDSVPVPFRATGGTPWVQLMPDATQLILSTRVPTQLPGPATPDEDPHWQAAETKLAAAWRQDLEWRGTASHAVHRSLASIFADFGDYTETLPLAERRAWRGEWQTRAALHALVGDDPNAAQQYIQRALAAYEHGLRGMIDARFAAALQQSATVWTGQLWTPPSTAVQ